MVEFEFKPSHCSHERQFEDLLSLEEILRTVGRGLPLMSEAGFWSWSKVLNQEPVSFKTKHTGIVMCPFCLC